MHSISLQSSDSSIVVNDILGRLGFAASNETGSDALKVSALILAVAEDTFDASSNPTSLTFSTGHSETATEKMRIDSIGNVGIGTATPSVELEVNGNMILDKGSANRPTKIHGDSLGFISKKGDSGGWQFSIDAIGVSDTVYKGFGFYGSADTLNSIWIGGGYDTPYAKFTTAETVLNENGANRDFRVEGDTDANLFFVDGSADKVGIGTDSPAGILHVKGEYSDGGHITIEDASSALKTRFYNGNTASVIAVDEGDAVGTSSLQISIDNSTKATFGASSTTFDQNVTINASTNQAIIGNSVTVFNEGGANIDFRVEGDTDANLLFLDASKDSVLIGTGSDGGVGSKLNIYEGNKTNSTYSRTINSLGRAYSTTDGAYYHTGLNSRAEKYLSASTTDGGYCIGVNAVPVIYSPDGTNTLAELSAFRCNPSINSAASNVTITNAYDIKTVPYFQGTNNTITNHYGLYLGNAGLGGTTPTNEYGVYQDNTNATNRFTGATAFGSYAPRGGYSVTSYGFMSVETAEAKLVAIDGTVASKIQASTNNNAGVIGTESAHPLHLYAGNSAKAVLTTNGKFGVGGAHDPTTYLDIDGDKMRVRDALTPASASASGSQGDMCWDSNYVYVCVATDTWKRSALSTW